MGRQQLIEERKKEFGTTKKQLGRLRFLADGLHGDGSRHGVAGGGLGTGGSRAGEPESVWVEAGERAALPRRRWPEECSDRPFLPRGTPPAPVVCARHRS